MRRSAVDKRMDCNGRDGRSAMLVRDDVPYQGKRGGNGREGLLYKGGEGL